jgi:hypothetical protein
MSGHLFCIAHNHVNMNMIWHRKIDQFWRQKANLLRFLERIKKFQNSNIMIIIYYLLFIMYIIRGTVGGIFQTLT